MRPTTSADVDRLRDAVEAYTREAGLEYYRHFSGLKETLEMAAVVERHGDAFTLEALRTILDAAAGTDDDDERRRHTALAQAMADLCIERELAGLGDELATAEARATVRVGGDEIPYHTAAVVVQNEPDRRRRAAVDAARMEVVASLDPLRRRLHTRHHELVATLRYPGYIELYSTLKGIDVRALGAMVQGFLDRTRELYLRSVAPWFEEVVGLDFGSAERHDAAVLFRMPERDEWFVASRMLPALRETLLGLGVALDDQPNVHLDTEDRPGKNPRAFCAPVRAPEEVYLVIRPTGGYQDYRALFHEAGHTEHFAHVDPARPFEDRLLGDNSVTEAFAFTLEHLLLDADWLADNIAGAEGDALAGMLRRAHTYYLYMLRRYSAKLLYELELHGAGPNPPTSMPQRYADILTEHLGFAYVPQPWLDDVDPGFYCAQYLRAWMLEARLRERWREVHGGRWWRPGAAGAELRSLWALGQALPAHLLTEELGLGPLTTDAVERRVRAGIEG